MNRNTDTLCRAIRSMVPYMDEDDYSEALVYTITDADGAEWNVYLSPFHHGPQEITLQCVRVHDAECAPVVGVYTGRCLEEMIDDAEALAIFLQRLPYARAIAAATIDIHRRSHA